ncbi:MAG: PEGA domain-containing protein [Polyangiales bacterium]
MRRLALAVVLSASFVQGAAAQTGDRWLIIPVATSADAWVAPTTARLYDELAARGVGVWAQELAAQRFEAEGSAPAPALTEAEEVRWRERSSAVLESLVRGNPGEAYTRLRETELLSLPTIVALDREPQHAQDTLDTCLLGVRALLETGSTEQAEAMARECRRLVIAGEPNAQMHPPRVTKLLAEADAERVERGAVLQVGSQPSQCAVRINGLRLGETPLEAPDLLPGHYAVQVECDPSGRGRAHYIEVQGFTALEVDARFDSAVVTRPTLGLRYPSEIEAAEHREADASKIARTVSAGTVVLVLAPETATLEIALLRGSASDKPTFARIKGSPGGPTRGDVALAARTLIDGKCMDLTTLPATVLPCGDEVASTEVPSKDVRPATRMPRGKLISGMTLFGAGAASLLTGYVLLGPRARASEDWVGALDAGQESAALQQKWFNTGNGLIVTASVGGGALVTAMPLALPKRAKTPWWAWLSGSLGVGLAVFSVTYGVTADTEPDTSCSDFITDSNDARTCVNRSEQISGAILAGATAAPLLAMPLVYLLRPSKSKLAPEVEISRAGGYVGVCGEF